MNIKPFQGKKFWVKPLMQKLRIGQRWPHAKFRRNRTILARVMAKKPENFSKILPLLAKI